MITERGINGYLWMYSGSKALKLITLPERINPLVACLTIDAMKRTFDEFAGRDTEVCLEVR